MVVNNSGHQYFDSLPLPGYMEKYIYHLSLQLLRVLWIVLPMDGNFKQQVTPGITHFRAGMWSSVPDFFVTIWEHVSRCVCHETKAAWTSEPLHEGDCPAESLGLVLTDERVK